MACGRRGVLRGAGGRGDGSCGAADRVAGDCECAGAGRMTFLAPWALWAAGAVSAAVVALHILASKNPKVTALPTTRFIPDVPLRATARALRLSDVLLML